MGGFESTNLCLFASLKLVFSSVICLKHTFIQFSINAFFNLLK